ncbi:MAG: hypothetical protein IPI92_18645 [Gemmatimonadetes bacterium]|jgi:hypothetical protein|nr:hypothetical protein [Gemmatimonadota bacterium]MBK7785085.1 hypothetical protein [Gemmatimonadota bacterium]
MLKALFAALVALHGLIHLMGPAKAWGLAELPQLTQPISRSAGAAWLAAALLCLCTAATLYLWPTRWWLFGLLAAVVSQAVIVSSWSDARFGTLANVVLLAGALYGLLSRGPWSFRAQYAAAVAAGTPSAPAAVLTEADLVRLPAPVQGYLRVSGAIGRPVPRSFRARWRGRIRGGPDKPWMPFTAEQVNGVDPASRLFLMDATMRGLPVQAFHQYQGAHATMRVKLLSLVPVADARGPEMDVAETVTLFNDLAVLAPAALAGPGIAWEAVDAHAARATFTNAGHTVHALLSFNAAGELVDFRSEERSRSSADGKTYVVTPWSTPLAGYRAFGPARLAGRGTGRWHAPEGAYDYIELDLLEVTYD